VSAPVFICDFDLPIRYFLDDDGRSWSVCQGKVAAGRPSGPVLLFESGDTFCLVREFPSDWYMLLTPQLLALKQHGERHTR
jgi:hypothetical protein